MNPRVEDLIRDLCRRDPRLAAGFARRTAERAMDQANTRPVSRASLPAIDKAMHAQNAARRAADFAEPLRRVSTEDAERVAAYRREQLETAAMVTAWWAGWAAQSAEEERDRQRCDLMDLASAAHPLSDTQQPTENP